MVKRPQKELAGRMKEEERGRAGGDRGMQKERERERENSTD